MKIRIGSSAIAIAGEGKKVPSRILLIRDGDPRIAGYDNLKLTAESAAQIIDAFEQQGNDLFVDYNHAIAKPMNDTNTAPAAGWVRCPGGMNYVPGEGLYVDVEWTDAAAEQIANRQFKYFSPLFHYNEAGEIDQVFNFALTNVPKTRGQTELLAASMDIGEMQKGKPQMDNDPKKVAAELPPGEGEAVDEVGNAIKSLGQMLRDQGVEIAEDADALTILGTVSEMLASKTPSDQTGDTMAAKAELGQVAAALGLDKTAKVGDIVAAASSMTIKGSHHDDLQKRIAALEADKTKSRVDGMVDAQIERGTLNPNDLKAVAAARTLAEKNPDEFTTLFASMVPTIEQGQKFDAKSTTPGTERGRMIAEASKEYQAGGPSIPDVEETHYVNACLQLEGQASLTAAEIEKLSYEPKVRS